jgi:hypothetical protein
MVKHDELGRTLALARQTLRGPRAMKERLRAQLTAGALAARVPAASPESTGWLAAAQRLLVRRYHVATVTLLVGAGFGAGFWLGRLPSEGLQDDRTPPATGAAPLGAVPTEAAVPAHGRSSAATAGASEATSGSNGEPPPTTDAGATATSDAPVHDSSRSAASATTPPATSSSATSATRRRLEPRPTRAASDDALMREVALLERVDRAIRAGEGAIAAALLDELDRSVPTPVLRHERAAAGVLARCAAAPAGGSSAQRQAHADAERFLARDPASVYADRIRAACPLDSAPTNEGARIEEGVRVGH